MRIGLTYDLQTDPALAQQAEYDRPEVIAALSGALRALGHEVMRLGGAAELLATPWRVREVELVFNLAEGAAGRCREAWVPTLLEHWQVPFVGAGASALALGLDKVMSKRLALASGLRTPAWVVARGPRDEPAIAQAAELGFPLIVKPRHEGSGLGIDRGAVVHTPSELRSRIAWLTERLEQPCLVEQVIPFGELTVLLIGNDPPMALPPMQRPLDPASRLACHVAGTERQHWLCPLELTPTLDAEAQRAAVTFFEALRCRDMARVDLRVDEQGTVYVLEINPLPSFDPDGSLGLIAECLGTTYTRLVGQMLDAALMRLGFPAAPQAAGDPRR